VRLFYACVDLCPGSGFAITWSPIKWVLLKNSRNYKSSQGPTQDCRVIDTFFFIEWGRWPLWPLVDDIELMSRRKNLIFVITFTHAHLCSMIWITHFALMRLFQGKTELLSHYNSWVIRREEYRSSIPDKETSLVPNQPHIQRETRAIFLRVKRLELEPASSNNSTLCHNLQVHNPYLRRLVACFSQWRPGFYSILDHVGFLV
jgi:hypothetical protein